MRYPSTSPERDTFFAAARIELAKAIAEVARCEAVAQAWRSAKHPMLDAALALAAHAECELKGARAAEDYWRVVISRQSALSPAQQSGS